MSRVLNGLKQRDAFLQLVFNFVSEYGNRDVQENQEARKFNRTHQIVVYTQGVHLFGDNINVVSSDKQANKKKNQQVRHSQWLKIHPSFTFH
jgi:hypothetical protein